MGDLVYEPYKDPLKPVEGGFGYIGTLAKSRDEEKVQCHVCGELFVNLGIHAAKKHGLKEHAYRIKFRLAKRTPLVSPAFRERCIKGAQNVSSEVMLQRLQNLKAGRERGSNTANRWQKSLEQKNKEGTCPDQLIQKIQELAALQGKTPTIEEFRKHYKGLVYATYQTFGSYRNAVKIAGLQHAAWGRAPQYTKQLLIQIIINFEKEHNRRPYSSDLSRGYLPSQWTFTKYFGSFSNALREANQ